MKVRASSPALGPVAPQWVAERLRQRARRDQAALLRSLRSRGAPRRGEGRAAALDRRRDRPARAARADRPAATARRRASGRARPHPAHRALRARRARPTPPTASITSTGAPELWAQGQTGRGVDRGGARHGTGAGLPAARDGARGSWFDPYDAARHALSTRTSHGHGTEVATVVSSIAPDARVIAGRVFSDGGRSTTSAVHRVFEWVLDPDGDPRTDDAPSVVNGSWDDGGPGRCETEFDGDLAALRAAGIVPVFAAGNSGPGREHGREPSLGAGRGRRRERLEPRCRLGLLGARPLALRQRDLPDDRRLRRGHLARRAPAARRSSPARRSRPRRSRAPSRCWPACSRARRPMRSSTRSCAAPATSAPPGVDPDTGAGILNVAQAAALLAGGDHAGPHVSMHGALVAGRIASRHRALGPRTGARRRNERRRHGGGLRLDCAACPRRPFAALAATPLDGERTRRSRACSRRREVRRLRTAATRCSCARATPTGNWGPVRPVVLPVDRAAPRMRASGSRTGAGVSAVLRVHDPGSGTALLRYRVEIGGHHGAWRSLKPAAQRAADAARAARQAGHPARARRWISWATRPARASSCRADGRHEIPKGGRDGRRWVPMRWPSRRWRRR